MSNQPPIEVPQGAIRLNTDSQKLEFYAQDQWYEMATEESTLLETEEFMQEIKQVVQKYKSSISLTTEGAVRY